MTSAWFHMQRLKYGRCKRRDAQIHARTRKGARPSSATRRRGCGCAVSRIAHGRSQRTKRLCVGARRRIAGRTRMAGRRRWRCNPREQGQERRNLRCTRAARASPPSQSARPRALARGTWQRPPAPRACERTPTPTSRGARTSGRAAAPCLRRPCIAPAMQRRAARPGKPAAAASSTNLCSSELSHGRAACAGSGCYGTRQDSVTDEEGENGPHAGEYARPLRCERAGARLPAGASLRGARAHAPAAFTHAGQGGCRPPPARRRQSWARCFARR